MNQEIAQAIASTMNDSTIGVEIECYVPRLASSQIDRELSARLPYNREAWGQGDRNYWVGKTDGSLTNPPSGMVGREYVAPPLKPSELFRQLETVLNVIKHHGGKVNKTCGLHVHIDASGFTPKRLQYLVNHMVKSEEALDKMLAPSRRGNSRWAKSMRPMLHTAIAGGRVQRGGNFRYRKLNCQAFLDHKTVEYRSHQGTLDFAKIVPWVAICQATTERCRLKVPVTETYQNPMHNVLLAIKIAEQNNNGQLTPILPPHRVLIQYVIDRMTQFGFGADAPTLA
jgi:hypothetical protein